MGLGGLLIRGNHFVFVGDRLQHGVTQNILAAALKSLADTFGSEIFSPYTNGEHEDKHKNTDRNECFCVHCILFLYLLHGVGIIYGAPQRYRVRGCSGCS